MGRKGILLKLIAGCHFTNEVEISGDTICFGIFQISLKMEVWRISTHDSKWEAAAKGPPRYP